MKRQGWHRQIRAGLAANINRLTHLSPARRAALLEAEMESALAATETGLPFGTPEESEEAARDNHSTRPTRNSSK